MKREVTPRCDLWEFMAKEPSRERESRCLQNILF
jgi:hypothetical protein